MKKAIIALGALLCISLVGVSCKGDKPGPKPGPGPQIKAKKLEVNPSEVELTVGQTKQLTITVEPTGATYKTESNNSKVATVAGSVVKAVAAGEATITVTAGDLKKEVKVTVKANETSDLEKRLFGNVLIPEDFATFTKEQQSIFDPFMTALGWQVLTTNLDPNEFGYEGTDKIEKKLYNSLLYIGKQGQTKAETYGYAFVPYIQVPDEPGKEPMELPVKHVMSTVNIVAQVFGDFSKRPDFKTLGLINFNNGQFYALGFQLTGLGENIDFFILAAATPAKDDKGEEVWINLQTGERVPKGTEGATYLIQHILLVRGHEALGKSSIKAANIRPMEISANMLKDLQAVKF